MRSFCQYCVPPNRFQVDSVTLVYQQHAVLKANLDQEMDMFCGDMGCDLWSRELWEKHFNKNMVIICTAEVLCQCLMRSFMTIGQINILIFDEAHHAKKEHPYARIIKEFYSQVPEKTRLPKIFGMTASPVDARVDVRHAAAQLEGLLQCEIATAADTSLLRYSSIQVREEKLASYGQLGPPFGTQLYKQMNELFSTSKIFKKPLTFAHDASRELGAWCADQVWPFCLSDEEVKKLEAKTERHHRNKKVPEPLIVLEQHKSRIQEAEAIVRAHHFDAPDYNEADCSSRNLSSKVLVLVKYLRERFERQTNDKCIVFVERRYTARLLAVLFSHRNIGTPHLHVGTLVSCSSSIHPI